MNKDFSDIHGTLIKYDLPQKEYIRRFIEEKPNNTLVLGPFGCGKTVFVTQFVSIRSSELETNKIPFRVMIVVDSESEETKLLKAGVLKPCMNCPK